MDSKPKEIFGTFARIEMLTWAMLIAAIIVRETIGIADTIFTIVGATHGFAFIGYAVTAVLVSVNQRWSPKGTTVAIALAIVPFATYPFERYLEKQSLLEGEWRIEAGSDPRDKTLFDGLFRWFIFRPVLLILVLLVFVVGLFSLLLWLGPPYQWGS